MRLSGTWLLRSTHFRFRLLSSIGVEELGTVEDQRRQASRGWYGSCLPVETERCYLRRLRHGSDRVRWQLPRVTVGLDFRRNEP